MSTMHEGYLSIKPKRLYFYFFFTETHRQMEALEIRDQTNLTQSNLTLPSGTDENGAAAAGADISGRERMRIEFFKTYDVMTGIRIAATLGGM